MNLRSNLDDRNIRRFERATRVQTFGRENAADFTAGSRAAELFAALDPIVAKLARERVGQLRGPVGKPVRIDALSTDFKDLARTARAIKLDEPDFDDAPFRHRATSVENTVDTHLALQAETASGIDCGISIDLNFA